MENQNVVETARLSAKAAEIVERNSWTLCVIDGRLENAWSCSPVVHVVTDRFAEVVQRYSSDAYVNVKRKDIRMTVSSLINLYNDYWDE